MSIQIRSDKLVHSHNFTVIYRLTWCSRYIGTVANITVQVADVCRPLRSVSVICDGHTGITKEMLYTDKEAVVVPAGALSKFLETSKRLATYPRVGGPYVH